MRGASRYVSLSCRDSMALDRRSGEVSARLRSGCARILCLKAVLKVSKDSLIPFRTMMPVTDVRCLLLPDDIDWAALSAESLRFEVEDTVEVRVRDVDPPLPDMGVAEGITEGDVAGQGNSTGGEEGDECGDDGGCGGDDGGTDGWRSWTSFVAPIPSPSLVLSPGDTC
jgi:hypothetical protein